MNEEELFKIATRMAEFIEYFKGDARDFRNYERCRERQLTLDKLSLHRKEIEDANPQS